MPRRRWTVSVHTTGRRRDVDVVLYDDLRTLRAAAARHENKHHHRGKRKYGEYAHTLAVAHGFERFRITKTNPDPPSDPLVAIIRIARPGLTPLVIAHEVAHVAQHVYGLDHDDERPVAEHMTTHNEPFAELYGELFAAIWFALGGSNVSAAIPGEVRSSA